MGDEKPTEVIAQMAALYGTMKRFSVMYDRLYVVIKLAQTLADPNRSEELKKCFEVFAKDLDRWHCMLKVIGAEDIWKKHAKLWGFAEEKGGDNK